VEGAGSARGIAVGSVFQLRGHHVPRENKKYLVVAATHTIQGPNYESLGGATPDDFYRCSFLAIESKRPFRPARLTPKPSIQGPQTAIVVGPAGEEIWTDKYGRVKVQFHWDRYGKSNQDSSCWVRVSQQWAGPGWGGVQLPRIGQEVIVEFLEGDPDRPIITGRVYNGVNMPPYELPANKTQSGIKSRSTKEGTPENFNEIRFEDKKGEEQLFIHAEKNQDIEVENDETHWVGHDRTKTIDNNETVHVKKDRTETVGQHETITIHGNRTETVDKDESITISGNRTETVTKDEKITISGGRTESVAKDESVSVNGKRTVSIGKDESVSIGGSRTETVEKNESITISGAHTLSVTKSSGIDIGKALSITAADEIVLKSGSASITLKKDGTIVIKGKDISVDGGGKVNVKASSDMILKGSKIAQNG
jgi:type VI secretion system secreted protein VgrG